MMRSARSQVISRGSTRRVSSILLCDGSNEMATNTSISRCCPRLLERHLSEDALPLLVRSPLEVDHLSGAHPGDCGSLRGPFHPHCGFPGDQLSPHHHRRRQRRDAHRSDGSDHHPPDRGGRQQRPGSRGCTLHHQSRFGRSGFVLQLERRHAADAPAGQCRHLAHSKHAPLYGADRNSPPRFRQFPDPRLQPHVRQGPANAALGSWPPTISSRA